VRRRARFAGAAGAAERYRRGVRLISAIALLLAALLALATCGPKDTTTASDTGETGTTGTTTTPTTAETTTAPTSSTATGTTETAATCADLRAEAVAFVEAHRDCAADEDCTSYFAWCIPENVCGGVAINTDHDPEQAMQLFMGLEEICADCGADPCGAGLRCVDNVCTLSVEF
jgi:hypothetical protein